MARKISWSWMVSDLYAWACNSKKAQVTSVDIRREFGIQAKAAERLMTLMQREELGGTTFVRIDDLRAWLKRVLDAYKAGGDPAVRALFEQIRTTEKPGVINRRIVEIERDHSEALRKAAEIMESVDKPAGLKLRRGRLEVSWSTMEQLVQGLYWLASEMQDEGYFMARYCPGLTPQPFAPASSPAAPQSPAPEHEQTSSPDPSH